MKASTQKEFVCPLCGMLFVRTKYYPRPEGKNISHGYFIRKGGSRDDTLIDHCSDVHNLRFMKLSQSFSNAETKRRIILRKMEVEFDLNARN